MNDENMNDENHMSDNRGQLERGEANLAADPGNPHLLAMVIDLSLACGEFARAERHVRAAQLAHPHDAYFMARAGELHLARRQWAEAAAIFADLLARQADVNLAYNLAYALQAQGRHADAWAVLEPYRESPELAASIVTLMVRVLHHLRRNEVAIALVEARLEHCQSDAGFLAAASLVSLDGGRLDLAERLGGAALAREDKGAPLEALVALGSLALARNDGVAASSLFEQVLARQPLEGRSWSGMGTASLLRRDFVAAQAQLERAVAYLPEHIGSWHLLGWSRIFNDDLTGAQQAFQQALELDRNFGESHGGMAAVLALQGLRDEAETAIELARKLDPNGLSASYAMMVLSGQTQDAERFPILVRRLLSTRKNLFGHALSELLDDHGPH
jgi:Flp pilus assembly protein TadD